MKFFHCRWNFGLAAIMALLLILLVLILLVAGCCQATPEQVALAKNSLNTMDKFYGGLVDAKVAPNPTVYRVNGQEVSAEALATILLSGLDMAAPIFEALHNGYCVDNAQINQAVAATVGAQQAAPQLGVAAPPLQPAK